MSDCAITLSIDNDPDLSLINPVVEQCVATWNLPDRVKRLVAPSYRYTEADVDHLTFATALVQGSRKLAGVAAWETADDADLVPKQSGLLLHGLYVAPHYQRCGIGSRLVECCAQAARQAGVQGILVKAQRDAEAFFERLGFSALPVVDERHDYAHRWWKSV